MSVFLFSSYFFSKVSTYINLILVSLSFLDQVNRFFLKKIKINKQTKDLMFCVSNFFNFSLLSSSGLIFATWHGNV